MRSTSWWRSRARASSSPHARDARVRGCAPQPAHAIERESPLTLTLAQGVSRGERMDLVVQKATELGASRLVPVLTERSVVRLDEQQSDRKSSHWRAIAIAACEQCGRNRLPEVALPAQLREFLRQPSGDSVRLLLSPAAPRRIEDVSRPA